jgi:hypothetical protein
MLRRTITAAATVFTAALAVTAAGTPAQAGECEASNPDTCGLVTNSTSNHMLVGRIVGDGHTTPNRCWFGWPWGNPKCEIFTQPVGTRNPTGGTPADVDGFTFTGTDFYYNGIHHNAHAWVRVVDGEWIYCEKPPGFVPRCLNI